MFEALAEAIEDLEIPPYGDALVEVIALRDRLNAAIAEAVGDFDAAGGWAGQGAVSLVSWLRHRADMTSGEAARLARAARWLRRLPVTSGLYGDGELSDGQVAAIVANLSDGTVALFAEHEAEVVPALAPLSVAQVARAMQHWRQRAEAIVGDPTEPHEPPSRLHHSLTLDGRWRTDGDWDAYAGAVIDRAIAAAMTPDAQGEERTPGQRRAHALFDICQSFLDSHPGAGTEDRRRPPGVDVVIDLEDLKVGIGTLLSGSPLDSVTLRRLLCDCGVHRVVTAGGSTVLDYGRSTRTVPRNLWHALVLRDRTCRHPGCDRRPSWCEAHHVVPWSEGGVTALDNLALGCSRHHHLWHSPGWEVKLLPDGEMHFTTPAGHVLVSRPPP